MATRKGRHLPEVPQAHWRDWRLGPGGAGGGSPPPSRVPAAPSLCPGALSHSAKLNVGRLGKPSWYNWIPRWSRPRAENRAAHLWFCCERLAWPLLPGSPGQLGPACPAWPRARPAFPRASPFPPDRRAGVTSSAQFSGFVTHGVVVALSGGRIARGEEQRFWEFPGDSVVRLCTFTEGVGSILVRELSSCKRYGAMHTQRSKGSELGMT